MTIMYSSVLSFLKCGFLEVMPVFLNLICLFNFFYMFLLEIKNTSQKFLNPSSRSTEYHPFC